MLAIDFETYQITSHEPSPKPVCLSWYDGTKEGLEVGLENIEEFLDMVALEHPLVVAHNMKFELGVIYRWFPKLRPKLERGLDNDQFMCSLINESLLQITRTPPQAIKKEGSEDIEKTSGKSSGLGLADLVLDYFSEDISEKKKDPNAWRLRYSELEGVDLKDWPQEAIDYAISDSIWAYKVAEIQLTGLAGRDLFSVVKAEHYLNYMGHYGILVDQSRVQQLEAEVRAKIQPSIDYLVENGLMRSESAELKPNTVKISKKIVKHVPKEALKITAAGKLSLTKTNLKRYIAECTDDTLKGELTTYYNYTYGGDSVQDQTDNKNSLINSGFLQEKPQKYTKNAKEFQNHLEKTVPKHILRHSAKGFISTSREHLEEYNSGEDPVLDNYVKLIEYEKVLSSFTSRLKQADPYIRTDYSGIKKTCRTSSRSTDLYPSVNIQQMPRRVEGVTFDIRNCYIPREGYKICSIDYSGLELASAGHMLFNYYGEGNLRDVLNSGETPRDLHSYLASRIMSMQKGEDIKYEEYVQRKKEKEFKDLRQISKQVGLGFPGGLGYSTLRSLLYRDGVRTKYVILNRAPSEYTILHDYRRFRNEFPNIRVERIGFKEWALVYDELVELKKELMNLYPELGAFLKEGHKDFMTGQKRRKKGDFGEWEWADMYKYEMHGFIRDWCTYTEFCNGYLMQSPAAVGAKRAACEVIKKYRGTGLVNPLAFIHDEIVFEVVATDEMYRLVDDVADIMISQMQTVLTSVRVAAEADIMDYWKKEGGFFQKTYFKDPIYKGKSCKPKCKIK